jgi:hypothetical protein
VLERLRAARQAVTSSSLPGVNDMAYGELEIGLHRRDAEHYQVELRFSQAGSDAEVRLSRGEPTLARFDLDRLRELQADGAAYGRELGASLLADPYLRQGLAQARSVAQSLGAPLRLRLFVGPSAPEMHSLHWETLRDPEDDSLLLTAEQLLFSRYLSSLDWRPVGPRPRATLRALVAIANPAGLEQYQPGGRPLAPVDVAGELERARAGLGAIPVTPLTTPGSASLNSLADNLRQGYDVLYLVCHGALVEGEPYLWLEDEAGAVEVVSGSELVTRVKEMRRRPLLIVLASCQSAGTGDEARAGDEGALAALGPRLAEAGIPAVLAMQGNVSMSTVATFMPAFFRELQRDGQIDRAAAVARGMVRDAHDWWMPVLFMRLRSGRLWYTPGFGEDRHGLEKWPALLRNIRLGRCTPILGPGLSEPLLGSRRQMARRWAEAYSYPMAAHDRDNLPQVAQYLAVNQDPIFARDELSESVRTEILEIYGPNLPAELRQATLSELISAVGRQRRLVDPDDPHRVLAGLPLPIFITAGFGNLLADALTEAGKEPQVTLCPWNEHVELSPSLYGAGAGYRPETVRPLVYHLFGNLREPDSVVLTEDDYFDFLIGVTGNKDLIPPVVRRALADTALLFLGFRMDDWDFRVLFRSLMSQEGRSRRSRYAHVAVQIDPEEGQILKPEGARRYLESYFEDADISIYWGSSEDFIQELGRRWQEGAS